MKKSLLLAAILGCTIAFSSCEKAEDTSLNVNISTEDWKETKNFTFTIKADFQNPDFSAPAPSTDAEFGISNEPSSSTQLAKTRAVSDYMVADGVEMTDLWVLDCVATVPEASASGLTIKQSLHQTPSDSNWGEPSLALTLGTHHILFLASRGQNPTYADGIVTWTKPLDTFFLDYEVTVVKTSNGNRAVTLQRIATRLQLSVEDAIPTGTTTISLSPAKWYNGFNMLNAQPVASEGYTLPFSISSSQWNRTGLLLSMWGLSPADEWTTDITITATVPEASASGSTTAILGAAPFLPNRTTRYTGNLFSNATQSSITLSSDWLPNYEGIY